MREKYLKYNRFLNCPSNVCMYACIFECLCRLLDLEEKKRWALAPMEKYVLNLTRNHYNIYDANQEAFLDLVRGDVDPTAVKIVRPTSSSKKGGTLTKLQLSLNRLTWRKKNSSKSSSNSTAASAAAVEMTEGVSTSKCGAHQSSTLSPVSNPVHTIFGRNNNNLSINGPPVTTTTNATTTAAAVVQSIAAFDSDDEGDNAV